MVRNGPGTRKIARALWALGVPRRMSKLLDTEGRRFSDPCIRHKRTTIRNLKAHFGYFCLFHMFALLLVCFPVCVV